jgi:FixJ family two-component response regulator
MIKNRPTIGIVDDEPSVCKALSRLITSAGFNAITYGSAQVFLDGDPTNEPDLLVLDVRMPGMNGLELQTHLAALGRTIPVVFITAHENELAKARAMASGAVAFFQKPLDEKDLLGAIHKALNIETT